MTLAEVIRIVEGVAASQPNIRTIVRGDIYELNQNPDAKYSVFGWTQRQHASSPDSPFMNFGFTFFYVDRLAQDSRNRLDVQSAGVAILDNILRNLHATDVVISSYTFQPFSQRFSDECAGVFVNVTISASAEGCSEVYADFNRDYNVDYITA